MTVSIGKATWEGTLKEGNGTVELGKSGIQFEIDRVYNQKLSIDLTFSIFKSLSTM